MNRCGQFRCCITRTSCHYSVYNGEGQWYSQEADPSCPESGYCTKIYAENVHLQKRVTSRKAQEFLRQDELASGRARSWSNWLRRRLQRSENPMRSDTKGLFGSCCWLCLSHIATDEAVWATMLSITMNRTPLHKGRCRLKLRQNELPWSGKGSHSCAHLIKHYVTRLSK
jgi:hypothetical protein